MKFPRKWYITLYIFKYILDDFSLDYLILSKFIMNLNTLLGCSYANATGPSAAAAAAARLQMLYGEASSGYDLYPSSHGGASLSTTLPTTMSNTRELCVVCNDKASGFHYGVMSCEGCKVSGETFPVFFQYFNCFFFIFNF